MNLWWPFVFGLLRIPSVSYFLIAKSYCFTSQIDLLRKHRSFVVFWNFSDQWSCNLSLWSTCSPEGAWSDHHGSGIIKFCFHTTNVPVDLRRRILDPSCHIFENSVLRRDIKSTMVIWKYCFIHDQSGHPETRNIKIDIWHRYFIHVISYWDW